MGQINLSSPKSSANAMSPSHPLTPSPHHLSPPHPLTSSPAHVPFPAANLVVLTILIAGTTSAQTARKHLENIHPERNWTSLIGCFQGLIKATGNELPRAAAMGLSGHAFRLEVDPQLRPDGMARINFDDAMPLYKNLGFDFDHFYGWLAADDEKPQHGRELNKKAFRELEVKAQMKVHLPIIF